MVPGETMRDRTEVAGLLRCAAVVVGLTVAVAVSSSAATISETGTLLNPEDTALMQLTLTAEGSVTLQTYGFGGGTNAGGSAISAGGFDAVVGLFSGSGDGAVFLNGTSDILSTYSPGCPPAGTVTVGSVAGQCGDVNLQFADLTAGTYTVLLSDAAYLPNAVFEDSPGYLGDGFTDLTGGVFQTCVDASDCNTDTANWALDITTSEASLPPSAVPEPPSSVLAGFGVALMAAWSWCKNRRFSIQ
jgi:hypothetical protein